MKKAQAYLRKNKKLSRLDTRLYYFARALYTLMIEHIPKQEALDTVYELYINLINISIGLNGEEPKKYLLKRLHDKINWTLDREISGPNSFILLNSYTHYFKMKEIMATLFKISSKEYLDKAEFKILIKEFRSNFSNIKNKGQI